MFSEVRHRARKAGQPPGTPVYTGKVTTPPRISLINYSSTDFHEVTGHSLQDCFSKQKPLEMTWIQVDGLSDIKLIEEVGKHYNLHPLTLEDILTVQQRPKIEEFEDYLFLTLKTLSWNSRKLTFTVKQISCVLGTNFVLSFQERETDLFKPVVDRLKSTTTQRMRQQGSDYLLYRLIDTVIDNYFVILEAIGEQIENVEESIVSMPTPKNSRTLYRLKRQMLILRKAIWPLREVINHLTQADEDYITSYTRVYLRDAYDHIVQAIDTVETFRDMLSSMLDVYLSSVTNRMNEVMKTLTVIATIFIPMTWVASIYGMNFDYMPELHYKLGYPIALGVMLIISILMLIYFRKKKWL